MGTASIWQKNKKTKQNNNKNSSSKQPKQLYFSFFSTATTPNVIWVWSRELLMTGAGSKHPLFIQLGGDQVTEGHVTWLTSTFIPIVFVSSRLLLLFSAQPDGEYARLKTLHRMTGCHVFLLWWCFFFFWHRSVLLTCVGHFVDWSSVLLKITTLSVFCSQVALLPKHYLHLFSRVTAGHRLHTLLPLPAAGSDQTPPTDGWASKQSSVCADEGRWPQRRRGWVGKRKERDSKAPTRKKTGRGKRLRGWILGGQGWEEKNKRRRKGG